MTQQPIVVGFDDSPASREALAWALRTAHGRGADVLLVHAAKTFPPMVVGHRTYVAFPHEIEIEVDAGEAVLQAGRLLAARLDPKVRVSTELVDDAPAAGILRVLDDAAMVVVGSRGLGGFSELLIGSTSLKLATHAPCPVIVVRDIAPEPGPEAGRVVVGVDNPGEASTDVLAFAFEEASVRHSGLTVLHAWQEPFFNLPGKGAPVPTRIQVEDFQVGQRRSLSEHLAGWHEKYPDVDVKPEVVAHNPAGVLVAASTGAELLVLGSHGHGGPHSVMMLGSVTHAVLHHAHCPVAVVGHR